MSIYRKNIITNDWVIFAPNRLNRPIELTHADEPDNIKILNDRPQYKKTCPFCKGNESELDKEIFSILKNGEWIVKILENKYSSLDRNTLPEIETQSLRNEMQGFGIHDVIIDNPLHNTTLALMKTEEIQFLLSGYLKRYQQLQSNNLVKHIVLFKNQGIKAGGSLEHPHSQIYGLPIIPFETNIRLREMERYYALNDTCLLCDMIKDEVNEDKRIIYHNDHFISFIPYAALSPYHFWIIPLGHHPSFSNISKDELKSFAECIHHSFYKLYHHLKNPDFNFVFQSLSQFDKEKEYYHWYLSVIPQIKHKGGLEYSGGLYVNPVLPEASAEELKKYKK